MTMKSLTAIEQRLSTIREALENGDPVDSHDWKVIAAIATAQAEMCDGGLEVVL